MVSMFRDTGVPMICCGEPMEEIKANTTDASQEKHVPVIAVEGDKVSVQVGSVPHPMTEEHRIVWIYLQTENGEQLSCVDTKDKPETCFKICNDDRIIAVFAYCNLHGLWKADYNK
jgi:superoxide reductase